MLDALQVLDGEQPKLRRAYNLNIKQRTHKQRREERFFKATRQINNKVVGKLCSAAGHCNEHGDSRHEAFGRSCIWSCRTGASTFLQ